MRKIPEGQLNFFDFLNTSFEEASPDIQVPRLFFEGEHVFHVQKGEVREYIITSETWDTENKETRYRVKDASQRFCSCIWDQNLNDDVFKTMDAAKKAATAYLKGKDYISPEDMHIVNFEAYAYTRECDQRQMVAFLCELENGMIYKKNFYTYHHLALPENKKKAIKDFYEQTEFKDSSCHKVNEIFYVPMLKRMYRVTADGSSSGWDYAEAAFSKAIG